MNKLINDFDRGFSLKNDDLRFVDAAVRLALADICKALGGETAILWGCGSVQIGTSLAVLEGAIFHDGEIWHVAAHTAVVANPIVTGPYWCFATSFDAAGAKLDMDLVSHSTYQVRTAFANATGTGSGVIAGELFSAVRRWTEVLFDNETAVIAMSPGITDVDAKVRRTQGIVIINGRINATLLAAPLSKIVFMIPDGFRPEKRISGYQPVALISTGVDYLAAYQIDEIGRFFYSLQNGAAAGDYAINISVQIYTV